MTPITAKNSKKCDVFDAASSIFVSANAGSGKTSLLTRRVLALLLSGVESGKILCLTYTKAAAAEMKERVTKRLGEWVMMEEMRLADDLESLLGFAPAQSHITRARSLFAEVLEAPDGLRIQTIHGLCQSLLSRFPLEAGVSPHFTVMDDRSEQSLLQQARAELLNELRSAADALQEAVRFLAVELGEHGFSALLDALISNKQKITMILQDGLFFAHDRLWQALDLPRDSSAETLAESMLPNEAWRIEALRYAANALVALDTKIAPAAGKVILEWLHHPQYEGEILYDYILAYLTKNATVRDFIAKCKIDAPAREALLAEAERLVKLEERLSALKTAQISSHTLTLAEALLGRYAGIKQSHGWMDYDDLIAATLRMFEKSAMASWVLFKLDGGIDHILVDEAQDTSPAQWAIIRALTEDFYAGLSKETADRSLFIVGDEKQSIFSFQGADPAGLARESHYFKGKIEQAQKSAHHLALSHSYRSAAEILQLVDAVIANPLARTGLSASEISQHHVTRKEAKGLVELWPLIRADEESSYHHTTQLAIHIAETIAGWIAAGEASAGDIMILLRKRGSLMATLARALKRRGVPVAGVDRMLLADNLAVQDLLALGQVLLLPEDDLTLAALLRSPLFNVAEETLFELSYDRQKASLWQRMTTIAGLREPYELIKDLRAKVDFISPFALFSYALDCMGGRAKILGRMGEEYAESIDEFLHQSLLYERSHAPSMQGFLHWMAEANSEIKRDMEQSGDLVRIMTVHGAKGLQAKTVILADTTTTPDSNETFYFGEKTLLFPKKYLADCMAVAGIKSIYLAANMAEYNRLLYVALTRAEDRLYIAGSTSKKELPPECWYRLTETSLAAIAQKDGEIYRLGEKPEATMQAKAKEHFSPLPILSLEWQQQEAPAEPTPTVPLAPSRLNNAAPANFSPASDSTSLLCGTLIHALLQFLPTASQPHRLALAQTIAAQFPELNEAIRKEAHNAAERILNHAEFAPLFSEGSRAEVPIIGRVLVDGSERVVSGQIDRLWVGASEVWIVDYKSNRIAPTQKIDTPKAYIEQLQLYTRLLGAIYPQKMIRAGLLWTAEPRLDWFDEATLDDYAKRAYI